MLTKHLGGREIHVAHAPADLQRGLFRATPRTAAACSPSSADVPYLGGYRLAEGWGRTVGNFRVVWGKHLDFSHVHSNALPVENHLDTHPFKLKPLPETDLYFCRRF